MTLPIPDKQYPDWSRFLSAVWMHGSSVRNINKHEANAAVDRAADSIRDSIVERNEARNIRPSSFVACGRQAYFMLKGEEPHKMPDNIGSTFAVGHLLHELAYAAVKSAMPEGILVETERAVSLPDWWPDHPAFNQSGHVDMVLTVTDIEAALPFLPKDVIKRHTQMLVDFKTMGSFSVRKHSKAVFGDDPDAFGYTAQLAIYTDALGIIDNGALLVGINRDSLTKPIIPRWITPEVLKSEAQRIKVAFEMAIEQTDPGEEFLVRHGEDANFFCGRKGKPGYCPFRTICGDHATVTD